jgi:hypothetical protein
MSQVRRLRFGRLPRETRIRRFFALSLATLALTKLCDTLVGAEIRFEFEATISQVEGDVAALNLPFTLNVGQRIQGRYVFPNESDLLDIFLHHERGKQANVTLTIDSTQIEAAANFGLLNSAAVLDPPIVGPTSSIYLAYRSPTDVFPGWPGTIAGNLWNHRLILLGPDGLISESEQLLDVNSWNQLTLARHLELQFGFPNTVSVRSLVGDFLLVPEPSGNWLAGVLVAVALAYFLFRR